MKIKLFLGLLFLFALEPSVALADNVQTGSSNAQSSVTNTVNGSNCQTHIITTVNGQTEVLNSSDCGSHTLTNSVNGTITKEPTPFPSLAKPTLKSPTITISKAPTATPTPTMMAAQKAYLQSLTAVLIKGIQAFFNRLFRAF